MDDVFADNGETFTVGLVGNYSNAGDYEAIEYNSDTVTTTITDNDVTDYTLRVSEEGLQDGNADTDDFDGDSNTQFDTTDAVTSSVVTNFNSAQGISLTPPVSGNLTWSVSNDGKTLIGSDGSVEVVEVNAVADSSGFWKLETTLKSAADHGDDGNIESELSFDIGVTAGTQPSTTLTLIIEDDSGLADDDVDTVDENTGVASGNVLSNDSVGADGGTLTEISTGSGSDQVVKPVAAAQVTIDGQYGSLTIDADGEYTYTYTPVEGDMGAISVSAYQLGESFLTDSGKFDGSSTGTVSTSGDFYGVASPGLGLPVSGQINTSGHQTEALAFGFNGQTVTSATVSVSNLFNTESGGEGARWYAFNASGDLVASGIISNDSGSDPYADSTDGVVWQNNNQATFTISDIGGFSTLVFDTVPYGQDGHASNDDSDYFVKIDGYEVSPTETGQYEDVFTYTLTDSDGDEVTATLTIDGDAVTGQAQPYIAPVAVDNNEEVGEDQTVEGNVIIDDDDNGGAQTGRDWDADTPVIDLAVNTIAPADSNGQATQINGDTVITTDYGTLTIRADGSYEYIANGAATQALDEGDTAEDIFNYTLLDPNGNVSDPAKLVITINGAKEPGFTFQIFASDAQGVPLTDTDGNYITQTQIEEENETSAYYVVLAVDENGDPLDSGDQPSGTVEVSFQNNGTTSTDDYTTADVVNSTVAVGSVFSSTAVDDAVSDNGETFTVGLVGNYSNAGNYQSIEYNSDTVTTTIIDDSDSPVASAEDISVDEDQLSGGNPGGIDDLETPVIEGNLLFNLGNDIPVQSITLSTAGDTTSFVTLDGVSVETFWDASSNTLIGYVAGGSATEASDQVFTIAVSNVTNGSATYSVTLLQPLQHHEPESADNIEGDLVLPINVSVLDSDGSEALASFNLTIDDDTPELGNFITLEVDNEAGASDSATNAGFLPGADGWGDVTLSGPALEGITYTSNTQADGTVVLTANDGQDDVFTLTLGLDGNYSFTLLKAEAGTVESDVTFGSTNAGSPTVGYQFGDVYATPTGTNDEVNPSTTGLSGDANSLAPGEAITFTFSSPQTEVDQVLFGLHAPQGGTFNYTIYDGNTVVATGSVEAVDEQLNILTPDDFTAIQLTVADSPAALKITSMQTVDLIAAPGQELEFAVEAADGDGDKVSGDISVAIAGGETTPPVEINTAPSASDSSASTDDTDAAGSAVDTDTGTMNFADFSNVSFAYDGGLGSATQTSNAGMTSFSATDGSWSLEINESTGAYTFTQYAPYQHDDGQDAATGTITVNLEDSDGDEGGATLTLTINDAGVTAVNDQAATTEGGTVTGKENLAFIIDTSGSMAWSSSEPGSSRLDMAKQAISDLFNSGNVNAVYLIAFSSGAESLGTGQWYTDLNAAMSVVNGLSANGSTDYDAALAEAMSSLAGNPPPPGGSSNKVVFLTDGEPNETNGTGSTGIDEGDTNNPGFDGLGEESYWIQFLADNGYDDAYAIGFGGIGQNEIDELEPIGVDVGAGETADTYEGGTVADDDHVIIVANGESLSAGVAQTIDPDPVTGNVLDNDSGVDVPLTLASVSYGGQDYVFADNNGAPVSFTLSSGGIDFGEVEISSDGSYTYELNSDADIASLLSADVTYVAQDNDGDSDSATLTLQAAPRVEVSSISADNGTMVSENGETSKTFTVNLESGPLAAQTFAVSLGALATGDATLSVNGANYDANTGIITVAAGVSSFGIVVSAVDDTAIEGTEYSTLAIGGQSIDISIEDNDSYNVINATSANDSLSGLIGGDEFVWQLSDVANTGTPEAPEFLQDVSLGGNGDRDDDAESGSFIVADGETVTVDFTFSAQDLNENGDEFSWRLEHREWGRWENYDSRREFDENDADGSGNIDSLTQSVTITEPGEYRLEFDTENGADAQITNISVTRTPDENTDTVSNFDATEDVLNIGDLLGGGASLSLNFDNGYAQLVVTDAGGDSTDQIINLNGVSQSSLQNALSLGSGADANQILSELVNQNVITDN
ncbi:MAG: beta strand repeat-containing protein [Marinobacterium sp.]